MKMGDSFENIAEESFLVVLKDYLFVEKDPARFLKLKEEINKLESGEKLFPAIAYDQYEIDVEAYIDNL
jgi:hypothetical protein